MRDPVIREALDFCGPLDLQSTLSLVQGLERVIQERKREMRLVRWLSSRLSEPEVLDRLRTRRDEPFVRDLLRFAYRLGWTTEPPGADNSPT